MGKFDITYRCFNFGVKVIQIAQLLPRTPAGYVMANQFIKSGTSVGANTVEAQDAISKKEFIRIMFIALKECRETLYWLALIEKTNLLSKETIEDCLKEAKEIRLILAAIIRKSKANP